MDFAYSDSSLAMQQKLRAFMETHVVPRNAAYIAATERGDFPPPFMEDLKDLAKAEGLWNLFLPALRDDEPGQGLSNMDYAPLAEIMGRMIWSAEIFNCNAPDTGNMELLHLFASPYQYDRWLKPLLNGEIRSAFAMTEPDVASSDATNIATRITRDGDDYVINGRKWFISNAADPRCEIFILMGVSNPDGESHNSHSMILIPRDTPGLEIKRNIPILSQLDPEGHCEILLRNVRVPKENLLGEEGTGFAMAQARLGPGRIHHCMRSIGQCEVAMELMLMRARERKTFGKHLHEHGSIQNWIALTRCEIEQARLLVLKAAWLIDQQGAKAARHEISLIKVIVPRIQCAITDRAIQLFGAAGLTPDTPLAFLYTWGRALRIVDGPDEVHIRAIARREIKRAEGNSQAAVFLTPPEVLEKASY